MKLCGSRIMVLFIVLWVIFLTGACGRNPLEIREEGYSADAVALGFDAVKLAAAEVRAAELRYIQSLLILRDTVMVSEHYYHGAFRSTVFNTCSVSKSFLSAITGIALREGDLKSLDQTVYEFFPEYFRAEDSPLKKQITIRHILTMATGQEWEEDWINPNSTSMRWVKSPDLVRSFVELPVQLSPGTTFTYNTAAAHTLSAILTRATGKSTLDYAQEHFFGPSGITISNWNRDPQGYYRGGSEMYFTAGEMARFGVLYLNGGILDGRQIIPSGWVSESTSKQVAVWSSWWVQHGVDGYGYFWWRRQSNGHDTYFAWGLGGQFIFVLPDLELVVAVTSSLESTASLATLLTHERSVFGLLDDYIIPAAAGM